MANPVEIIEKKTSLKSQEIKDKYSRYIKVGLIIFILIIIAILICFLHQFPCFDLNLPIDSERWGQFGDFIGGVLGTIITLISIIFLYNAFIQQQLTNDKTQEANDELKKQSQQATRFNK